MGKWQIQHCSERFLLHQTTSCLVAMNIDGQSGWTFEQDVEAELRRDLLEQPSWHNWRDGMQALAELETRAHQAALRVATRHADEFEEWGDTMLTGIAMVAQHGHVQWFGAGSFKARIFRDKKLVQEFGSPLPRDVLTYFNLRQHNAELRQANLADFVIFEGGFASLNNPNQVLTSYGEFDVQKGDELIIAKRSFFNGYEQTDEKWSQYKDPPLDWSEFERAHVGSRHVRPDNVFLACFA